MTRPRIAFFAAILLAGTAVLPSLACAGDDDTPSIDDTPHITVVGTAQARVAPDLAEIRLGVDSQKPTAAEAWSATGSLVRGIVDAAKAAGVKPQDIGSTRLSLYRHYDSVRQPDGSFKQEPQGFDAVHDLSIRSTDLDKIGTLAQSLIDKGANTFQGITFEIAAPDALQDKLYGEALVAAHRRAETIAMAAGVKLGRLLQVERPDRPAPLRPLVRSFAAGAPTMPVEPGTQEVSAEVEATYAIE